MTENLLKIFKKQGEIESLKEERRIYIWRGLNKNLVEILDLLENRNRLQSWNDRHKASGFGLILVLFIPEYEVYMFSAFIWGT